MPDHARSRPRYTKHTIKFTCWRCGKSWEQPDYYRRQNCYYCGASPEVMGYALPTFEEPPMFVNTPADRIAQNLAPGPGGPGAGNKQSKGMIRMKIQLFIVDPQNDFCVADDGQGHKGALVVGGAHDDMKRLAKMVQRVGSKLDDIHITLDSHQTIGIERPGWFKNAKDGAPVAPFTVLGLDAKNRIVQMRLDNGAFVPTDVEVVTVKPSLYDYSRKYLVQLTAGKRYPHVVWTTHCVVGTWGWSLVPELSEAVCGWERDNFVRVDYVVKGNNPMTEHFSGVKAEVPDPADPLTQVNTGLIQTLEEADIIAVAGEALSHCVANTVRDIATLFSDPQYVKKMVLLTDASSNVGGFEFLGNAFMKELTAKGMQTSTTTDFLA